MKAIVKSIQFLTALLILTGIGYGIWYIINLIWRAFSDLNDGIVAAIVTATATFLVTLLSIILGKSYERKLLIEKEMRDKKIPVYNEFIEFIFKILNSSKTNNQLSEKEMTDFVINFTKEILIWGSDDVIFQWSKYRKSALENAMNGSNIDSMFELEKLLIAIRKDTGHKKSKIERGELLRLFINDIDKYIHPK
ncbi:hypothetical protein [Sporosarcina cyprini]|uniref:hypothetical protein n=1 Tax=Sporosarcina cyprini TaxID=2910523 RepID=UPI001EDE165C|nr:hypothetical protein [Sporosarcina cyprini]MCG3088366.1 hypothetical protein [Sporosarcina cyprini]